MIQTIGKTDDNEDLESLLVNDDFKSSLCIKIMKKCKWTAFV